MLDAGGSEDAVMELTVKGAPIRGFAGRTCDRERLDLRHGTAGRHRGYGLLGVVVLVFAQPQLESLERCL